jgi:hypothetical protein
MKIAVVPTPTPIQKEANPPSFLIFGWSGPYEDDERAQAGGIHDLKSSCNTLDEVRAWFQTDNHNHENVQVVSLNDIKTH